MFRWTDYEIVTETAKANSPRFSATHTNTPFARHPGTLLAATHRISNLTREEALHWLTHDPHGRSFARERGEPLDVLADHLVAASRSQLRNATRHQKWT